MKNNKYKYLKVIQQNWGYGWDDVDFYDTSDPQAMAEFKVNYSLYLENQPECQHRVITRRVLVESNNQ